jgi:competence protein ComEA
MNNILKTLGLALLLALPLAAAGGTTAKAKAKAPSHPINLNTASVTELMQLPKVGAHTAQRIVAFRKEHGGFQRPEDLMNVKGIGEKSFQKLKPYLSAGTGSPQVTMAVEPKASKAPKAPKTAGK